MPWLMWSKHSLGLYLTLLHIAIKTFAQGTSCTFQPDSNSHQVRCETVAVPDFCASALGSNRTSFPNVFDHTNQAQAQNFLSNPFMQRILKLNCSTYGVHFLCSALFPLCVPHQFQRVEPCRELCVSVRESCLPELIELDSSFKWPDELDCHRFPLSGSRLCIWSGACGTGIPTSPGGRTTTTTSDSENTSETFCPGHLTSTGNTTQTVFGGVEHCTESCQGVYFEHAQLNSIVIWIATWSLVCLLVSCITCLTYVVNYRKVPPLEVPIGCITFCYACIAFIYTLSTALGRDRLICDKEFVNSFNESALLVDGLNSPLCTALFSVLYYFTLCTWTWWGVFTIEWFLCSLRFKNISNIWRLCFHIAAWGLPLVLLIVVLALGRVSGDPITQSCWVSKHHELPFLIVPLLGIVVLCSVIIVISFARVVNLQSSSLSKKRTHSRQSGGKHEMQVNVLRRIGLYCTVYLLPMGILLCTYFYEFWYREQWEMQYLKCQELQSLSSRSTCVENARPILAVFFVKILASLVMGVISVLWVLRKSSFVAWRRVCCIGQWDKPNDSSYSPNEMGMRFGNESPPVHTILVTTTTTIPTTPTNSSESYSPNVLVSTTCTTNTSRCENMTTPCSVSSIFTESVV